MVAHDASLSVRKRTRETLTSRGKHAGLLSYVRLRDHLRDTPPAVCVGDSDGEQTETGSRVTSCDRLDAEIGARVCAAWW